MLASPVMIENMFCDQLSREYRLSAPVNKENKSHTKARIGDLF